MAGQSFGEEVIKLLMKRYGKETHTALKHKNGVELFVAVLLSPQCTDKQVNKTTAELFKRFHTFDDYANADLRALMQELKGINFYKTKARHLKESARLILERHGGKIPKTIKELTELPGVGRKVANVILNELYGINEGIAIDTHCITTANRLGLAKGKNPEKVEKALMEKLPQKYWGVASNLLIALGRDTCKANKKECYRCILNRICPSSLTTNQRREIRKDFIYSHKEIKWQRAG